jgi:hypothetical protein
MRTFVNRCIAVLLLCAVSPAFAQLAQYGYVVGTLVPAKSYLEKIDPADKGKFLHYHIFLNTASAGEYEVVIDVNDVSTTTPLIYRIASLNNQSAAELSANFGPVFGASSDFHLISNTKTSYGPLLTPDDAGKKAAGALDYLRHPGILKAIRNLPWQNMYAQGTADPLQWALPQLDALFKPSTGPIFFPVSTKVYVFGAPFTTGKGIHVAHQNQADIGNQFSGTNATWQDGGVIVERHSLLINGSVSRSILMTKFSNQTDFSAESNDLSHPNLPGHTLPTPTPAAQTYSLGLICGDYPTFGPFSATQLEVKTSGVTGSPAGPNSAPKMSIHVKSAPFTDYNDQGDFTVTDDAMSASGRAFARAYSPMSQIYFLPSHIWFNVRSNYYVRVEAIDAPGSWCDSAIGGTLSVTKY